MQNEITFPANLLKFTAYVKVVKSLADAIKVIKEKRLAYGEPCIVTYEDKVDGETVRKILFGIGTMNPDEPYFFNQMDENVTSIMYSKEEPANITDTEFSYGNIVLGEGAVKHVTDIVEEDSSALVTSAGVYNFINNKLDEIMSLVNERLDSINNE